MLQREQSFLEFKREELKKTFRELFLRRSTEKRILRRRSTGLINFLDKKSVRDEEFKTVCLAKKTFLFYFDFFNVYRILIEKSKINK